MMVKEQDKHGIDREGLDSSIRPIYERVMKGLEVVPDRVHKCSACKGSEWVETEEGNRQCQCLIARIKMQKFEALMKDCHIPGMERMTFEAYKPTNESQRRAKATVQAFKRGPKGFYLVGDTGVGKTHLMAALAQRVVNELSLPAIVFSAAVLFDNLLSGAMEVREEKLKKVIKIPLLVIDDLCMERKTEAVANIMWSLINERYNAFGHRVTCFTSNTMQSQLKDVPGYSATLIDRIRGLADEIVVTGPSGR